MQMNQMKLIIPLKTNIHFEWFYDFPKFSKKQFIILKPYLNMKDIFKILTHNLNVLFKKSLI